eukprot:1151797-Pelagomonas_calceolata.AAC.1
MARLVEGSLCAYCTEWAWSFCASLGMGSIGSPTHTQEDCVEGGLGTLNLVAHMHFGFQSILKVWEVHQTGNRGGRFRCTLSCLFPSQSSNVAERVAAWASARDAVLVGLLSLRLTWRNNVPCVKDRVVAHILNEPLGFWNITG